MLIGRECELEMLVGLLGGPVTGTAILVHGDSGSGKSRLLRAAVERARCDGDTVLVASGDPLEAGFAFGIVRQLFERAAVAAARADGDRDGLFAGPAAAAAAVLAPWTLGAGDPGSDPTPYDVGDGRDGSDDPEQAPEPDPALLNGLYWLALNLAGSGRLVLVIDDLQWADTASLAWLRYLLRRAPGLPVVLIGALGPGRAPAADEPLGAVLPLFRHQLTLSGLGPEDTAAVVRELFGTSADRSFALECHRVTGGNPFLLYALLRSLRAAGLKPDADAAADLLHHLPPDVGRAVYTLLANAGPHATPVAQAVAVLGGSPALDLVAYCADLDPRQAEDATHAMIRAGLMSREGDGIGLLCPALATAVADGVLPSVRQRMHQRAARRLIAAQAPAEEIAVHLLPGPLGEPDTAGVLRRAAARAMARGCPERAAEYLHRALREPLEERERAALLIECGEAELASSVPAAVRHLERGLALAGSPAERATAARPLAAALFALDRHSDGLAVLNDASTALRETDAAEALRLETEFVFAGLTQAASAPAVLPRLLELDLDEAGDEAARRAVAALLSLRAAMTGDRPSRVAAFARQALSQGLHPGDDRSAVYLGAVLALACAGQAELALSHADAAVAQAASDGSGLLYARACATRAGVALRLGRVLRAETDATASLAAIARVGVDPHSSHAVAPVTVLIDAMLKQGRVAEADACLERSGLAGDLDGHWINDYALLVRGRLRAAQGRPAEALADFLHCGRRSCDRAMPGPWLLPWRSEAALTHAALGDAEAARALAAEELELARDFDVPEVIGAALRAVGLVTGGPEGLDTLRLAVEVLSGTPAELTLAAACADLGAQARRAGRLAEARRHLKRAADTAHRLGAEAIADQALAELRAIGDRPRGRAFHGVEALTPTERRVAALAARGRTNREIAQQLFVGLRTVEVHLTNTYGKLGIAGRAQLAQALGGLLDDAADAGGAGDGAHPAATPAAPATSSGTAAGAASAGRPRIPAARRPQER
ncbi:ATP-binding protein [Kitasatospora camelliae]|uniref:AAA family ATPase n=1 Tax=Kitasatospora camelliae TaxID=3156397 RepID=A0AAU8JSI3_9ACTN